MSQSMMQNITILMIVGLFILYGAVFGGIYFFYWIKEGLSDIGGNQNGYRKIGSEKKGTRRWSVNP